MTSLTVLSGQLSSRIWAKISGKRSVAGHRFLSEMAFCVVNLVKKHASFFFSPFFFFK